MRFNLNLKVAYEFKLPIACKLLLTRYGFRGFKLLPSIYFLKLKSVFNCKHLNLFDCRELLKANQSFCDDSAIFVYFSPLIVSRRALCVQNQNARKLMNGTATRN